MVTLVLKSLAAWILLSVLSALLMGRWFQMQNPYLRCPRRIDALQRNDGCLRCSERLECDS
jgi:hypothetical protein